jgi:hypothetical protein
MNKENCAPQKLVEGMEVVVLVKPESIFYELIMPSVRGMWLDGVVEAVTANYVIVRLDQVNGLLEYIYPTQQPSDPKQIYIVRKVAKIKP